MCELGIFSPEKNNCVCVAQTYKYPNEQVHGFPMDSSPVSPTRCQGHLFGWAAVTQLFRTRAIFPSLENNRPSLRFHETCMNTIALGACLAQIRRGLRRAKGRTVSPPVQFALLGGSSRLVAGYEFQVGLNLPGPIAQMWLKLPRGSKPPWDGGAGTHGVALPPVPRKNGFRA